MASAGCANLTALAVDLDGAAGGPDRAGKRGEQFVLALPFERDDAGDLAIPEIEGDVAELGADAQIADAEARRTVRRARRVSAGACGRRHAPSRSLAPSISSTMLLLDARRDVDDADGLAVAQHGGAVAQRRDLDEAVRDEDDGAAGLALAPHDVEHPLGEVGGQCRGHLVEQQHVGLDRQRARQVEHAQHGQRNVARGVAHIEIGNAELAHPVAERLDRRPRQAKVGQRRRDRGSATAPDRPKPARRGGRRRASARRAPAPRIRMRPASAGWRRSGS